MKASTFIATLAGWVGATSDLLTPLVEAVRSHVMTATKLHADDTPVPVLAPGHGRTRTGRLWTYVRDGPGFRRSNRAGRVVRLLARPQGREPTPASAALQGSTPGRGSHGQLFVRGVEADAYAGFQQLYDSGNIVEVACWAHTRRKFHEIHVAHASPVTTEAIERIAALYVIEAEIRGSTPDVRKIVRQARARPLLNSLFLWLEQTLAKLSRKSDTAAGIRYALARRTALTRYAEDGQLEIDNNAAERALRTVALGRKNYFFCGSDAGGERAAQIYSLLGSAKLNSLDPELYLHHVLQRTADQPINRIHDLLPWNVSLQNTLTNATK